MRKIVSSVLATALLVGLGLSPAQAQRPEPGSVELLMLGGVTIVSPERGDKSTFIGAPSGSPAFPLSPMVRISYWSKSSIVIDGGFSFMRISGNSDDLAIMNLEVGIGGAFGSPESRTFPFIGGLLGLLHASNGGSETSPYVGASAGLRIIARENSTQRIQIGYRRFLNSNLGFDSSIELSIGFGFII